MSTIQSYRTIKDARAELRRWGKFWSNYYSGGTGGIMHAFMQNMRSSTKYGRRVARKDEAKRNPCVGIELEYEATAVATRTPIPENQKEVFVPWELQSLDDFIESLDSRLSDPLRRKYVRNEDVAGLWLDRAENAVMLRK